MTAREMAEALYNLASDMDYGDYEETKGKDVSDIEEDLKNVSSTLFNCLENIVVFNS